MKKIIKSVLIIFFFWESAAHGQHTILRIINDQKKEGASFKDVRLFGFPQTPYSGETELKHVLKESTLLDYRKSDARQLIDEHPASILLIIPVSADSSMELELFHSSITTPDFTIHTARDAEKPFAYKDGLHYWGIIKGDPASICAISIFDDEVMGMISTPVTGNVVLGKIKGNENGLHILYNEKDLLAAPPIRCLTPADAGRYTGEELHTPPQDLSNCIRVYWEMNNDIYTDKGSVTNTVNYAIGLFNQSSILYANDNIPVELSQVYVWDTISPYNGTDPLTLLTQFQAARNSYTGDIGNLLGYAGGGGVAASINGLCSVNLDYTQCYSGVSASFQLVPTFSWSVEVVTHEQGHLLGSRHTHACVWNGNGTAIDGCGPSAGYPYEGSCSGAPVPAGGGTIMSYCHLTGVGINFSLGFGPQPTAVILNNFNNATCLSPCNGGIFCSAASGLSTDSINTSSAIFNWTAVTGAASYRIRYRVTGTTSWNLDSSLSNSYHAAGLIPGTNYEWQVQTVCSSNSATFSSSAFFITVPLVCNAPTADSTSYITSQSAVFTWHAAAAAIGYNIQYRRVGTTTWITATTTGNSYRATGLVPNTGYQWQVQTICAGGGTSGFSGINNFKTLEAGAPVTIILQPDAACGKDALIGNNVPTATNIHNFGNFPEFNALAWTAGGSTSDHRSLIEFDLSFIPPGSLVTGAYLSLYWNPTSVNVGHSTLSGSNSAFLKEITSPWSESTVTWVNQPGTDTIHQVSLPASTSNNQDYLHIDVTDMIQDFVNNPAANYGMMIQEQNENPYRSLLFASSDHPDPSLHPKLEINYLPNISDCLSLQYSNCEGVDAEIGNCVLAGYDTTNFGSIPEFDAVAWTYSGSITNIRSLVYWDFATIPVNAMVTNATMTLYWNPNSANVGHSAQSGSNEAYIEKITSPWSEDAVTWNTQPPTDTLHRAYLPASTSAQQDYTIDVTDLVQDLVSNPALNYGMMLKLNNESYFRSLVFCSSDHPDPAKHPRIDVCYTLPTGVQQVTKEGGISIQQDFNSETVLVKNANGFERGSSLLLYTMDGKLARRFDSLAGNEFKFATTNFAGGIYIIQMIGGGTDWIGKILLR